MILKIASLDNKIVENSVGFVDTLSVFPEEKKVKVSVERVNRLLGVSLSAD